MIFNAGFYYGTVPAIVNGTSMTFSTDLTATQVNSTSYAYGNLEVSNNSTNFDEINMWIGSDGLSNFIGTNIVYDTNKGGYMSGVPGNSSFTKIVTIGTNNFYFSGYNGTNLYYISSVAVLSNQTTIITIPSSWTYSAINILRNSSLINTPANLKVRSLQK
jgi:hypothetical protein